MEPPTVASGNTDSRENQEKVETQPVVEVALK